MRGRALLAGASPLPFCFALVLGHRCPERSPRHARDPARGHVEAMALYAGQSAGAVEDVTPAADVAREMDEGAVRLLRAGS